MPPRPEERPPDFLPRKASGQRPPRGDGDQWTGDMLQPSIPRLWRDRRRVRHAASEKGLRRRRECVLRATVRVSGNDELLRRDRVCPILLQHLVPPRVRVLVDPFQEAGVLERLAPEEAAGRSPRLIALPLVEEAHGVRCRHGRPMPLSTQEAGAGEGLPRHPEHVHNVRREGRPRPLRRGSVGVEEGQRGRARRGGEMLGSREVVTCHGS